MYMNGNKIIVINKIRRKENARKRGGMRFAEVRITSQFARIHTGLDIK